jgi:hypothetical protein
MKKLIKFCGVMPIIFAVALTAQADVTVKLLAPNDFVVEDRASSVDNLVVKNAGGVFVPRGALVIGTATTATAGTSLDLSSAAGAMMLPQVALTGATDVATVATPVAGMMVFNTAAAGTAPNNVEANTLYLHNGTGWVAAISTAGSATYHNYRIVTGTKSAANPAVINDTDSYLFLRLDSASTPDGAVAAGTIGNSAPYLNTSFNLQLPDPSLQPGRVITMINDSWNVGSAQDIYTNYPVYGMWSLNVSSYTTKPGGDNNYRMLNSSSVHKAQQRIVSDGTRWISSNITVW